MLLSALQPFSWTTATPACAFMAATTASMPPAAATFGWLSARTAMLRSAQQPFSWTAATPACAFMAATTASMPPTTATLS